MDYSTFYKNLGSIIAVVPWQSIVAALADGGVAERARDLGILLECMK